MYKLEPPIAFSPVPFFILFQIFHKKWERQPPSLTLRLRLMFLCVQDHEMFKIALVGGLLIALGLEARGGRKETKTNNSRAGRR